MSTTTVREWSSGALKPGEVHVPPILWASPTWPVGAKALREGRAVLMGLWFPCFGVQIRLWKAQETLWN